jgi:glycosyltransferase 2 family protein
MTAPATRATVTVTGTAPAARRRSVDRRVWASARVLGGVAVLALLLWRVGTGPFLDGLRMVHGGALAAAVGLGALSTASSAWRWALIARRLGVDLPLGPALAAYYRSQFLNTTLPGGMIGDIHRAVRHGRDIGDLALDVRAVVVERLAGLIVTVLLATAVLTAFPSPVRAHLPAAALTLAALGLAALGLAALTTRAYARHGPARARRALATAGTHLRTGLATPRTGIGVLLATAAVLGGHLTTFLLAARTAGATAPLSLLTPLTLLALLATALPVNIAGWGPREAVAAWAFGAAGLTPGQGVATAVVYGMLVLVANLPGAAVLIGRRFGRQRATRPTIGQDRFHG